MEIYKLLNKLLKDAIEDKDWQLYYDKFLENDELLKYLYLEKQVKTTEYTGPLTLSYTCARYEFNSILSRLNKEKYFNTLTVAQFITILKLIAIGEFAFLQACTQLCKKDKDWNINDMKRSYFISDIKIAESKEHIDPNEINPKINVGYDFWTGKDHIIGSWRRLHIMIFLKQKIQQDLDKYLNMPFQAATTAYLDNLKICYSADYVGVTAQEKNINILLKNLATTFKDVLQDYRKAHPFL